MEEVEQLIEAAKGSSGRPSRRMAEMGHFRHFKAIGDESALPAIADVLWRRSEPPSP